MRPFCLTLFLALPLAYAGEVTAPAEEMLLPETSGASAWLVPQLDFRARYEFGDVEGLDRSHGLTLRARPGLTTREWNGLSAMVEGSFTWAAINDYDAGGGARPRTPGNSSIGDPESAVLNQAYLQYLFNDTQFRGGRQRIAYDNGAFISNSPWRQTEQTYDGFTLHDESLEGLSFDLAWIGRVNRVFGSTASGAFRSLRSNIWLANASWEANSNLSVGGYIYRMRFHNKFPAVQSSGWDNDTYGLQADAEAFGLEWHGELAWQEKAGSNNDRQGWYTHFHVTKKFLDQSIRLGLEHLDAGVQTPLATMHAFNGFADVFGGARGTGNAAQVGLTDLYLSHSLPLAWELQWANAVHIYGDNSIGTDLGYEFNSTLSKKFNNNLAGLAQFSHFESRNALFPHTTRITCELNYSF